MNSAAKLTHLSSSIKFKSIFKPTIDLSILENYLQKCQNLKHFNQILSQMILTGFIQDTFAASRLLKFSSASPFVPLHFSLQIFLHIENPNGYIYNTLMKAYVRRNSPQNALFLYKSMLDKRLYSDGYTFPILVQASAARLSISEGEQIHDHVWKMGFNSDVYVQNTLINMYSVCGNMSDARRLFDESRVLDLVSWNSMLAGYVRVGHVEEAKYIYSRMPERNIIASNSMIVLLGNSGNVDEASELFRKISLKDLVSWTALISCYEQNGMYEEALALFVKMNADGVMVDDIVLVTVLSACAHLMAARTGKMVHCLALRRGLESFVNLQNALIHMYLKCGEIAAAERLFDGSCCLDQISWTSMISGYLRCGSVEKAKALFDSMPKKDTVSWSVMISGYAQNCLFSETLAMFQEMQLHGFGAEGMTLVNVISACTHLAALDQGKLIHDYVKTNRIKINVVLGTTLVDMYMKCGCVEKALEVFYEMEERETSTWNALILGLAMNGVVEKSLNMFSDMKNCGIVPNEITFLGILGACRHMGLVDEGRIYFNSMIQEYKIEPNIKHYGCMVDLLGRAGLLKEAEELIQNMPVAPDAAIWGALLGACNKYGDHEMGERIGRKLVELQPDHDGIHVLLSNIYASKGSWDDVLEIREMMIQHNVPKTPGSSMV